MLTSDKAGREAGWNAWGQRLVYRCCHCIMSIVRLPYLSSSDGSDSNCTYTHTPTPPLEKEGRGGAVWGGRFRLSILKE